VAGADAYGRAVVWDARTGAVRESLERASGNVIGAAFSADGGRVAVAEGAKGRARIWDTGRWRPESVVPAEKAGEILLSAQFAADRVLTVDFAGRAQLSDPATGTSTGLPGSTVPAAVAVRADGQSAIGTTEGELRVFSAGGQTLGTEVAPGGAVNSVSYDRAGTTIATGGRDGTVSLWNARTLTHTKLQAPGGQVTSATFSPDGRLVLVTYGSVTRLWDRRLGRVLLELPPTPDASAEFSPDGQSIVLAGGDRLEILRCYACMPLDALERHARSLLPAP
jgi:WD40 repeat protein